MLSILRALGARAALLVALTTTLAAAPDSAPVATGGSAWGKNYFPNVSLTSHEGKELRFFDDLIAGKVVVINFIYTTCPDACPLETAKLSEVQQILGDRVGQDIFFYSITIDPERDTPAVLKDYSERFQTGPGWLFLTGDNDDIVLLRKKLGLYMDDLDQEAGDHNLSMIIGNQSTGRWMKRSPFENPYVLASDIGGSLHNYTTKAASGGSYDDAPELRKITKGETLFRTRCATCHVFGTGDGKPRVGPNLLGVFDRREEEWLRRWIYEPDVMIAEEDSIAMGLYLAYGQVPMPNMRLNAVELDAIMDYMKAEDRRVAKVESVAELAERVDQEVPSCCEKNEIGVFASKELDAVEGASEGSCCEEESTSSCCEDDLASGEKSCCEEESAPSCCEEELTSELAAAGASDEAASTRGDDGVEQSEKPTRGRPFSPLSLALAGVFATLAVVVRLGR